MLGRSEPCHRCVTHSRNQEDTEGHRRTQRPSKLSTGGHWRNRRDTGGHEIRRVRDREAPGSNPGPPTIFAFETRDFRRRPVPTLIDSGMPVDADGSDPPTEESAGILAQLRELRVRPEDVEVVICTHFDIDHVGHHEHFINAEHIVQREQYEVAVSGAERFASGRSHWDAPGTQRRLVDGDVELMPGLRLVETSGHAPGHQSVLVTLPGTGPVLVAGDAVSLERQFSVDRQPRSYEDADRLRESTRKLLDLVSREKVVLTVFHHDGEQWRKLRRAPEAYE